MSNSKYTNGDYQNAVGQLVSREVIACASTLVYELAQKSEQFPDYQDELISAFRGVTDYAEAARGEGWARTASGIFYALDDEQHYLVVNINECGVMYVAVNHCTEPGQGPNGKIIWSYIGTLEKSENLDGSGFLDLTDPDDVLNYLYDINSISATAELHTDKMCGFQTSEADDWEDLCNLESIDTDDYEPEIFEHWIVSDWLARKLEDYGQLILRDFFGFTIWGRATTGQAISLDRVICDIYDDIQSQAAA